MAALSKKDKLIEDAQKFVQRGQFDKAAKIYEQILTIEPATIPLRQKLAELLIKCGRIDDARKELETVGKYFSKNGFFLKSVAVYKQLQKLFPTDIAITLTLAELNENLGLIANALAEYKLVYEYNQTTNNIDGALQILDRMQNVDPKNIPIKIKLAEAYIQYGKKAESYSLFFKTAALLLERSDNSTLAKISARVLQLFPDKPNFMLDLLTEQIDNGKAEIAITSIQNLLRSNPNSKPAWDLTVRAYQLLGQSQRLKIAYQHYLKFFPSEPVAMLGFISSVAAEQDFDQAVKLLDQYEDAIISGGFIAELKQIYHSLDKLKPINDRISQGLARIDSATDHTTKIPSLPDETKSVDTISKIEEALSLNTNTALDLDNLEPPSFYDLSTTDSSTVDSNILEQSTNSAFDDDGAEDLSTIKNGDNISFALPPETAQHLDEEIEIDIDIDSPFGSFDDEVTSASATDNWLDSVSELFDTISTSPTGVKFGNEMDSSDARSHFDLGQAFKEMGLYDEAINEFRTASQDSSMRVECLIMQCVCLRERGEVEKAISMLQALLKPGLSIEETCAVKYELATGFEAVGKVEEAHLLLTEINAVNPDFKDINSRVDSTNVSGSLDFSDDDLKDF